MKLKNLLLISSLIYFSQLLPNAQNISEKILFLNYRYVNNKTELISMRVVKGILKISKQSILKDGGYYFSVISDQDEIIYENTFNDPTRNIYEYPGINGQIQSIEFKNDTLNFYLRIPYSENINKILIQKALTKNDLATSTDFVIENPIEIVIDHSKIEIRE